MKESIKIIIKSIIKALKIFLIIALVCIIFTYFVYKISAKRAVETFDPKIGINSRQININILEDKVLFEDTIIFERHKFVERDARYYFTNGELLSKVEMILEHIDNSSIWGSMLQDRYLNLSQNFLEFKDNFAKVKLNYEVDKDFLVRYNDTDFLSLFISTENMDYINNLKITLKSDSKISDLIVKRIKDEKYSKDVKVNYINGKYVIIIDNVDVEKSFKIDMTFNIDDKLNNIVDLSFAESKKIDTKLESKYIDKDDILMLNKFILVTMVVCAIAFIINRNAKTKISNKEISNLISPILAEGIIDKKIGIKELIMTTIVELNIRGNIKIINNEVLELVSIEKIEPYEKEIVELLFEKEKIIKFKDINRIFIESNVKTAEFSKKITLIKNLLTDKLFSENIFSRKLTVINKLIKTAAILIIINILYLFFIPMGDDIGTCIIFSFYYFIYCIVKYIKKYIKEETNITKIRLQEKIVNIDKTFYSKRGSYIIIFVILFLSFSITIIKSNFVFSIMTFVALLLNIFTIYLSDNIPLTGKGKEEQIKLLKLRNYINDYSLIKNRDLESVIVWDEYLAYAIAFGIPNEVIKSICEDWYDLNINLQMIAKIVY